MPPRPEPKPETNKPVRPPRPPIKPGREWHWFKGEWHDVPVAVHVADDYRVRIAACQAGAVRFEFDPAQQRVLAFMPDGAQWHPH
jgi:hypothetical protein